MKMTRETSDGDVVRLRCEGPFDLHVGSNSANPFEDALGMGCYANKVLLNMEESSSINSIGVAWLVKCHRSFEEAGGKLVLHSIAPMVLNVLRLLNMPKLLHMAEDEAEAAKLISAWFKSG